MRPLTFTLRAEPPERLDLSPLTPQRLAGLSHAAIEAIRVGRSKRALAVGDLFRVTGSDPEQIIFEGGSDRFDRIGSDMAGGSIRVAGHAGAQAGRLMRAGSLLVEGNAGPHAGSAMRGGRIEILGDTGDSVGGPLAGEMAGMAGGVLIVRGRAGATAGDRMRRGLIAILQGCGDYAGSRMIAGTLVVAGGIGQMPGYLMRRGSIVLDRRPRLVSPSFVECGTPQTAFHGLLDRYLSGEGIVAGRFLGDVVGRYGGDSAVLGKGEILFRASGKAGNGER